LKWKLMFMPRWAWTFIFLFTFPTQQRWQACTTTPSYSGGKKQEDLSLKPAQTNSSRNPVLKIPNTKKPGMVEWLKW
jgi:hypothetical protein